MALSQQDREALTVRVERKLAGRRISREAIRATVEQVCSTLDSPVPPATEPDVIVVMSAPSTPDLASRLRHRLERDGVQLTDVGVATAGRHTVCVVRVSAGVASAVQAVAEGFGWAVAETVSGAELLA